MNGGNSVRINMDYFGAAFPLDATSEKNNCCAPWTQYIIYYRLEIIDVSVKRFS